MEQNNKKAVPTATDFSDLNQQYCTLSNQYQASSDNYRALSKAYRSELGALEKNYEKIKKSNSKLLIREFLYKKTFEDNKAEIESLNQELARERLSKDTRGGKVLSFLGGILIGVVLTAYRLFVAR